MVYQDDLMTPGIFPASASSRNWMRETPYLRLKPRGRPLIEQRLRMRIFEEFLGSFCSLVCAAKNCSSVVAGFARTAFSSARTLAYFSTSRLRLSFFWIAEVFGMSEGSGGG